MDRQDLALALWIWVAVALVLVLGLGEPLVPQCLEDQTLVGVGEFVDGRWEAYVCGP